MRITRPKGALFQHWQVDEALQTLLTAPSPQQAPPCPHCRCHRPALCSPACPDAPAACSSDPERYPIEPAALPLVYELNALKVFQSCWSCEGHLDAAGEMWKKPQVSFYAASSVCVMLLANYLQSMYQLRHLMYCWHIVFVDYGVSLLPTYCIEPRLEASEPPHLGKLQKDLRTMSHDLGRAIRLRANEYLQQPGS